MQENNNINLLGLKDISITNVKEDNEFVYVDAYVNKMTTCPYCGSKKIWIHDHRIHNIKDTNLRVKKCIIHLRRTKYNCKSCNKRFEKDLDFIAKGHTITKSLVSCIVRDLKSVYSISSIAKNFNVSNNMVHRILDLIYTPRLTLPEVLCIDEFKGNSGNYKYQCSLLDGLTHSIIDILQKEIVFG